MFLLIYYSSVPRNKQLHAPNYFGAFCSVARVTDADAIHYQWTREYNEVLIT